MAVNEKNKDLFKGPQFTAEIILCVMPISGLGASDPLNGRRFYPFAEPRSGRHTGLGRVEAFTTQFG